MTSRTTPVLRWAILQDGHVVADRTDERPKSLNLGELWLDAEELRQLGQSRNYVLLEHRRGRWGLRLTPGMRGQLVRSDGSTVALDELWASRLARAQGNELVVALDANDKGRVSLGETTVLFQFVPAKPEVPAPKLPPEARGTWLGRIDGTFAMTLACMFVIEFGGTYAIAQRPINLQEIELDQIADRFNPVALAPKPAKQPETTAKKTDKDDGAPNAPKPSGDESTQKRPKLSEKQLRDAMKKMGLLKALHSLGSMTEGAVGASIGTVEPGKQLAEALKDAHGVSDIDPGSLIGKNNLPESGEVQHIGDIHVQPKAEQVKLRDPSVGGAPTGPRVDPETYPQFPLPMMPGEIDPGVIARVARQHMPALQLCYEHAIKKNPGLHGRVVVRFVIGTQGKVVDVDIDEDGMGSDEVNRCLDLNMRRWVFPVSPHEEMPVSYPLVFTPAE